MLAVHTNQLNVRSATYSHSQHHQHKRHRGRSQQVSHVGLARRASEERRQKEAKERNTEEAAVRVDPGKNNPLRGNHDAPPPPLQCNASPSPPQHPHHHHQPSITDNVDSLLDQLHDAYAADNFVLARMLVLRLDGIHVTDPSDPRIDLVTDADFDRHFMPHGPLQIDGLPKSHTTPSPVTDIRNMLVAKEGWVLEKANLWDESRRRIREERLRWEEKRRSMTRANAGTSRQAHRPPRTSHPRVVLSYTSLVREQPAKEEHNELVYGYMDMSTCKGKQRSRSQLSQTSSSSSWSPSTISDRAPSVVPFKDVLACMRGPLFPPDLSDVVTPKGELTPASWNSQRMQTSRDVKRFQRECMSFLQSSPECADDGKKDVRPLIRGKRHIERTRLQTLLATPCATCQLRALSNAATPGSVASPSGASRPLSWLSFRSSLSSPSASESSSASSGSSSAVSSTNSSLITTPATSPTTTPLSLSPSKPPLPLPSPGHVLDLTPPLPLPNPPSQGLSPSQSHLLALSQQPKPASRVRSPTFSVFASWLRPSPKLQTRRLSQYQPSAPAFSSPDTVPASPSDPSPGCTCSRLGRSQRMPVPQHQDPLSADSNFPSHIESVCNRGEVARGHGRLRGTSSGHENGIPSPLAALGRVLQRFRQFHEVYVTAMTTEFGEEEGGGNDWNRGLRSSRDSSAKAENGDPKASASPSRRSRDLEGPGASHPRAARSATRLDMASYPQRPLRRGRSRSRRWRGAHADDTLELFGRGDTWDAYEYRHGADRRRIPPRGFRACTDDVKYVFGPRHSPSPPRTCRVSPSPDRPNASSDESSSSSSSASKSRSRSREHGDERGDPDAARVDAPTSSSEGQQPSGVVVYIPLAPRYPIPPLPPHLAASRRASQSYAHASELAFSRAGGQSSQSSRSRGRGRARIPYEPYACVFGCDCRADEDDVYAYAGVPKDPDAFVDGNDGRAPTTVSWGRPGPTYVRPVANPVFLRLKAARNRAQQRPPPPSPPGPKVNTDLSALDDSDSDDEDENVLTDGMNEGEGKEAQAQALAKMFLHEQERALAALLGAGRAGAMGSGQERVCGVGGGARMRSLLAVGAVSVAPISVR